MKKMNFWLFCIGLTFIFSDVSSGTNNLKDTVLIVVLFRNKEHILPYFLGHLEKLDYPKNRIMLWFRSDHNIDRTYEVLDKWIMKEGHHYHDVNLKVQQDSLYYEDEKSTFHWTEKRFRHVIRLKEEALRAARTLWADYVWFLDCDTIFTSNQTLNILIQQERSLVAPMLESLGAYSNFWCGMNDEYYYKRTEDYMLILERKKKGCFEVPMIHTAVLVNLRRESSLRLSFDPSRLKDYKSPPEDDIISFALSAKSADISMNILNTEVFGYVMVPLEAEHQLSDDYEQMISLKVHILAESLSLTPSLHLLEFVRSPIPDKLGFDEVYMINLMRRHERRQHMMMAFAELSIDAKVFDAVDGRQLNDSYLEHQGIRMLPQYEDPYHKRPLTMGEIGCFLSHYGIWKEVVDKNLRAVIVFEDDIRFQPYFRSKLKKMMNDIQRLGLEWDLIYLGRKRLLEKDEPYVTGSDSLVWVEYSYWTLCYILTLEGAQKLMGAQPLTKMVPVDEFLPIMFDKHPEAKWKEAFDNRNLRAFSANPLLVHPTHYTGEDNYISDTEDSQTIHKPPATQRSEL